MSSPAPGLVHISADIARQAHEGQFRLDAEKRPYIVHPALAADLVGKLETKDEEVIAAAWLHDVIEDTPLKTPDDFTRAFSTRGYADAASIKRIYGLVDELTMPDDIVWEKVRSYQIDKIASLSPAAKILKMADQVANYLDGMPAKWSAEKIRAYSFKSLDICAACAEAAPYIYEVFLAFRASNESLSRHEVSQLVGKVASARAEGRPADAAGAPVLPALGVATPLSAAISVFPAAADKAAGLRVAEKEGDTLADRLRARIEETGIFVKTFPVEGDARTLAFAAPVDIAVLRSFAEAA